MSVPLLQIAKDAMLELARIQVNQTPGPAQQEFLLNLANRILNDWNAERAAVYADQFLTFTIPVGPDSFTIGPTGDFVVGQRPETIDGANIILTNATPHVRSPLAIRDSQWWLGETVPTITSQLPTDLYYNAEWPNGRIFLWPVPTVAYQLEIWTRAVLTYFASMADTFNFPPGYQSALTLTLAEQSASGFGVEASAKTISLAMKARARVWANNDATPSLVTNDFGIEGPRTGGVRSDFNWQTGQVTWR